MTTNKRYAWEVLIVQQHIDFMLYDIWTQQMQKESQGQQVIVDGLIRLVPNDPESIGKAEELVKRITLDFVDNAEKRTFEEWSKKFEKPPFPCEWREAPETEVNEDTYRSMVQFKEYICGFYQRNSST